jgi:hypothetical protein
VTVLMDTPRYNATTDLGELRTVLAQAPASLFSHDLQDLALSFNLGRPVLNDKNYKRFEIRAQQGEKGYLIISERALGSGPMAPCIRQVATGLVMRRPFAVLDPTECVEKATVANVRPSG